jgi:hypothetical protein
MSSTMAIVVRVVTDPDGKRSVLLQLPPEACWITTGAADARRLAAALLETADELDEELHGGQ